MARIQFDQDELLQANERSSIVPDKPEYSQNKFSAAFRVANTGAKLYQMGKAEAEADTTKVDDLEFTRENLYKHLKDNNYNSAVIEDVMTTPASSWKQALGRAEYKRTQLDAEAQVGEMGTVGAFALMAPMAVFDVDTLFGGPLYKGVKFLGKGKGLASQMAKKAEIPLTGAATGAVAVATENVLTGQDDVTALEGALFGGALGLGIAGLTKKLESQSSLNKYKDGQGRVLSDQEAKAEELAARNKEQEVLDELIEEVESIVTKEKDTAKAVAEAEVRDRKLARVDKRIVKEKLTELADGAKKVFDDAQTLVGNVAKEIESLTARTLANAEEVAGLKEAIKFVKATEAERKELVSKIGTQTGQIADLQRRLAELKGVEGTKALEKRKSIRATLAKLKDEVAPTQARISVLDKRLEKADQGTAERLKQLEEERRLLDKAVTARSKQIAKDIERRDKAQADLEKAEAERDGYSTKVTIAEARYTPETLTLRDRLEAFGADLSPEGLRKLIMRREGLAADVTKLLENDDLDVKALKAVRADRQNYIVKLQKELEDIDKAASLKDSKTFKRLPQWMQKAVISPIEKNLASENEFVRGLAQRLHSGTMYHGKINNRNAWNLRTLLDHKRTRMEQAIIYSYRQAVKEGYSGKFHEFEAEVADNARRVTGDIQRQLFTEMDGGLDGIQRLEVAKTRLGSVTRNHYNNNKHVQDGTDAFLNYFEDIHSHGNKLDMEAFRNSLGKGYVKRVYSAEKIKAMGETEAVNRLVEAQKSFAIATNGRWDDEVLAEATAKAEKAVKSALNPEGRVEEALRELGPARRATESALKQRTIEAFDDDLIDLMESDVRTTSYLYSIQTHGRLALKEALGVDNDEQIKKMIMDINPTAEEAKNFEVMVETIKGTREISKNPLNPFTRAAKAASGYSSVMHTLGFVVPTVTEIASVAKEFGWSRTINNFIGNPREVIDMYRNGTPADKNTIELFVSYGDAYVNNRAVRYDADGNNIDSVGRMQSFLDGTTQRMAIFGGLLPVTDMLRMTTASLSVDFLARMSVAKKISKADMQRIEDMGFDANDFERIRTTLKVGEDGRIGNMDRKTWGQLDEDIMLGVNTMVERTILHPNGITLPKFMSDFNEGQFFPRIMFKFMRFPFESYERMLGRGMQEFDAKQATALAGNIALWTMILAAKDALKEEDKQKYTGKDGLDQLMVDSFLYNSWTAGPVSFIDTGLGLTTGETLQGYRYSIGGALASDYQSAMKGDFRVSLPLGSLNAGDGVGMAFQTLGLMEESNKEE
jgi:hypothetical protein